MKIIGSYIFNNSATNGGFLYKPKEFSQFLNIDNSSINNNLATQEGGFLAGYFTEINLMDSNLTLNKASKGGVLSIKDILLIKLTRCLLENN